MTLHSSTSTCCLGFHPLYAKMGCEFKLIQARDIARIFGCLTLSHQNAKMLSVNRSNSRKLMDDSQKSLLRNGSSLDRMVRRSSMKTKVPKGCLAVYVGPEMRRYVIPASFLSGYDFRVLMESVEEEFGFEQQGALKFPCDEEEFEEILIRCYAKHDWMKKKSFKR
ncbi:hypothetical protein IFM89_037357 [Coptis chinensis]|uniref:Uncharacterized protein n=1 Tax=Coptis chinensis TaxID=261450 RepID=A0A835M3B1_9MAGN|nr:hypothetical protein IFM89_037357 [Coptis chinensis]